MSDNRERLEEYLKTHVGNSVEYIRAKEIADDVELTPKQIGVFLSQLSRSDNDDIHVKKWARHTSTTWAVKTTEA